MAVQGEILPEDTTQGGVDRSPSVLPTELLSGMLGLLLGSSLRPPWLVLAEEIPGGGADLSLFLAVDIGLLFLSPLLKPALEFLSPVARSGWDFLLEWSCIPAGTC